MQQLVKFESEMERVFGQIWWTAKGKVFEVCGKKSLYVYATTDKGIAVMRKGVERAQRKF